MEFAQEVLQLRPAVPQRVPFRLSPLGFLFQGTQTLAEGGYKLSKHRHHVIQRTHGFCKHSALQTDNIDPMVQRCPTTAKRWSGKRAKV